MRSVSAYGIPKWSTPAVVHRAQAVPPPTDITVTAMVTNVDKDIVEVEAQVQTMPFGLLMYVAMYYIYIHACI